MKKETIKKMFQFIANPRLLLCLGIAWIITNGWSYVLMAIGTWLRIEWMQLLAGGYLTFLWLPISPEKLITIALAIALLRLLFPNDQKTLKILKDLHAKVKQQIKTRKHAHTQHRKRIHSMDIYHDHTQTLQTLSQAFGISEEDMRNAVLRAYSFNTEDNNDRIRKVFCKAARGEEITVAGIGGSITQGAKAKIGNNATAYNEALGGEKCWFFRTVEWFRSRFPQTTVNEVNAGIGATPSFLGTFRLEQMVLQYKPDLVTVEFSVNDPSTFHFLLKDEIFDAYESIVRRCLEAGIAVIQVFLNDQDNNGLQRYHSQIAKHYHVPTISYHNAISPDSQLICDWELLSPDEIHPNNTGHALLATCVCNYLDHVYATTDLNKAYADTPIPSNWVYSDTFHKVTVKYANKLKDHIEGGFAFHTDTPDCKKWFGTLVCNNAEGSIQLTAPKGAKRIWIQYYTSKGSFETELDGQMTVCNTSPLGWPKSLWHRVHTGKPLEKDLPLVIRAHSRGQVIILGLLAAF